MSDLELHLRSEVARILQDGSVDLVVGFEAESIPLKPQPTFIEDSKDADRLIINGFCQNNLATFLIRLPKEKRIGIVVRGCESRSINALIVENQHARDKLYLIGVPCHGIIDWRKVEALAGENIISAEENENIVNVHTIRSQFSIDRGDLLHDSCARCLHPNPVSPDIMLGELLPEGDPVLARSVVDEFQLLSSEKRYAFFTQEAERCIRCYACREACPMCYCTECFVDHANPRWTESTISPAGTQAWHIVRAFHQAGRCVSCGACERACPMDIKMTYLTDKLNDDLRRLYGFQVGMDTSTQPPFAAFSLDDKKRFIS